MKYSIKTPTAVALSLVVALLSFSSSSRADITDIFPGDHLKGEQTCQGKMWMLQSVYDPNRYILWNEIFSDTGDLLTVVGYHYFDGLPKQEEVQYLALSDFTAAYTYPQVRRFCARAVVTAGSLSGQSNAVRYTFNNFKVQY